MGSQFFVFDHPPVRGLTDVAQAGEQVLVQDSLAERAVESFDIGVLVGLGPGWMYWIATPLAMAQAVKASPRNSGPLLERSTCGSPWSR